MLFMLALFAARGDPHFPFLLPCYAQATLFPRLPSSLSKTKACVPSRKSLCSSSIQSPPLAAAAAPASEYFLGGIGRDESDDHMELPSPLQCSVKVEIRGYDPALTNMLDCQIFPLGQQYRMVGWNPKEWRSTKYRGVGFLPMNKDGGGGEFVMILNLTRTLLVLRSSEMRWMQVKKFPRAAWKDLVAFKGRFYTTVRDKNIFVIDPYSLEATLLMPLQRRGRSIKHLVASGNDELFLVERTTPPNEVFDFSRFVCRVSRLDEEAGKWVEVSDLGDRVLFIRDLGNVFCSAKELPDSCGLSGNSILFADGPGNITASYKYGLHTGREGDDLKFLRPSGQNHVGIVSEYPLMALHVEPLKFRLDTFDICLFSYLEMKN